MVRVTDHFLDCIVYLCVADAARGTPVPRGTAFAVTVPDGDSPDVAHCYLVTARHDLELARTDRIIVRVNTEQGFRDVDTDRTRWHMHDSADVAALLFSGEHV